MPARPDIDHPTLGRLVYDAEFQWYAGVVERAGQPLELQLPVDRGPGEPAALLHAARIVARLDQLAPAARACAARELRACLGNDNDDDDDAADAPPLAVDALADRLQLRALLVARDGAAEFFHDDGGLFDDACVLVRMEPDERFDEAHVISEADE